MPANGKWDLIRRLKDNLRNTVGSSTAIMGFALLLQNKHDTGTEFVFRFYRVGHEKVASLPFCTCPCDVLSGISMYKVVQI